MAATNSGTFSFDWTTNYLQKNLAKMKSKLPATVLMYASTQAVSLEAYMKKNRPWTDRTNMAKMMLQTKVSQPSESMVRITLAHGVSYGIWLEIAHERNYAIIEPTIRLQGPQVINGFNDILGRLNLGV